ncbi:hypothetical protein F3Y22_tig00001732pilonHSYRG00014 [Hibiscus syriacus]|uniref:Pentatricopeptide repeat-containing protein n=1 Tax=Hibiscus syriacus TaxID=106335 RepID=A0A6A3CZ98_HIBSY|nr:hypothetical protein F3Y22_tig00001732pilonHSYRG00014 [Hibiscus syriacus]
MPKRDKFSWTLMMTCFARNGELEKARELFDLFPGRRDAAFWNVMVQWYGQKGRVAKAKKLFDEMPLRNVISWNSMLSCYTRNGEMHLGREFFEGMAMRDVVSWNLMVDWFIEVGDLDSAWELFQKIPYPNVVSGVTMLCGLARSGITKLRRLRGCLGRYRTGIQYAQMGRTDKVFDLFKEMENKDLVTWNTMIIGYAKTGEMDKAVKIFEEMKIKNVVSWNSLISGFLQIGLSMECLIIMYAKCGRILSSQLIFDYLEEVDVISWNSLIDGYACNGYGKEAVQLFQQMVLKGVRPDHITFIGVLSGCCHIGLVDQGLKLFKHMTDIYSIEPSIRENARIRGALLAVCKTHGNLKLGNIAAKQLSEFEPDKTSNFVLLSNMQAEAGSWDEVEKTRLSMNDTEAEKQPGCSWIEVRHQLHCFWSNMLMQPETTEAYSQLKALTSQINNLDCVSNLASVLDNL